MNGVHFADFIRRVDVPMSEFAFGPESLHLHLSVSGWAADGLLAIFFFVVGLELKREFVAGDLRDPRRAALPIAAAVGGMIVPAAIFIAINLTSGHPENLDGWAVPIATDIHEIGQADGAEVEGHQCHHGRITAGLLPAGNRRA